MFKHLASNKRCDEGESIQINVMTHWLHCVCAECRVNNLCESAGSLVPILWLTTRCHCYDRSSSIWRWTIWRLNLRPRQSNTPPLKMYWYQGSVVHGSSSPTWIWQLYQTVTWSTRTVVSSLQLMLQIAFRNKTLHARPEKNSEVTCGVSYSRVLLPSSLSRASARDKGSWHRTAHQKGKRTKCFYSTYSHQTSSVSLYVSTSIQSGSCNSSHASLSPRTQRRQRKELCRHQRLIVQ